MRLTINQRATGAVTAQLVLTASEVLVMTERQTEDLSVGLALLQAALMPDDSFDHQDQAGRALEVLAAHELADLAATGDDMWRQFQAGLPMADR